ncbi:MAG: DUF45 domain-containing protein [Rhodocyclaceae bacterium]|jgi:glutathione S-transferase|nr:DUF45 domain-containing protein [Rhodocyclaceae bacterium]
MPKPGPQLSLRLDAAPPEPDARWCAGGRVAYLGGWLTLRLDTDRRTPERVGEELHLPLPPGASPRQIRDMAEAWLRDEAQRILQSLAQKSALAGRHPCRVMLSFSRHGDWARREGDVLRCHWRLIEQPLPVIEQALARALAEQTSTAADDLFSLA